MAHLLFVVVIPPHFLVAVIHRSPDHGRVRREHNPGVLEPFVPEEKTHNRKLVNIGLDPFASLCRYVRKSYLPLYLGSSVRSAEGGAAKNNNRTA